MMVYDFMTIRTGKSNQARGVKVIQRARHSLMKIDKRRRIMPWENEEDCR
jgi:hypothetical protein